MWEREERGNGLAEYLQAITCGTKGVQ